MGTMLRLVQKDLKITPKEQWESQLNTDVIPCQHDCLQKDSFKFNAEDGGRICHKESGVNFPCM